MKRIPSNEDVDNYSELYVTWKGKTTINVLPFNSQNKQIVNGFKQTVNGSKQFGYQFKRIAENVKRLGKVQKRKAENVKELNEIIKRKV